ncbi:hypothetical protein FRC00_012228, partial [Tulasnella sp. 408]
MYAQRVRTLNFDLYPTKGNTFDVTTFQTIAQYRPPEGDLLPNLRKFTYDAGQAPLPDALSSFLIFLGSSVAELELRGISQAATPGILTYVARRAPQLQDLNIGGDQSSEIDSSALTTCLTCLEKLKRLHTWSINLTPSLWDAMAQHQCLTSAAFVAAPRGHSPTTTDFQPRTFAKLEKLVIREDFDFLCRLFESQNVLPKMVRVAFEGGSTGHVQGRSDFRRLCELLPQKLPNLILVWFDYHSNAAQEEGPLELGDFRPLLQCKNLRVFHLTHSCGVALTVDEVGQLLDAWPSIRKLHLQYALDNVIARPNLIRIKWSQPTLPLSVLDTLAEKNPKVEDLSLILDANAPLSSLRKPGQHQFECLNQLDVPLSTVSHPATVAGYLAQRSKKRFSLTFGLPQSLRRTIRKRFEEEKNKWDQVAENLTVLYDQKERLADEFRMQMQEERARYMQELREV